MSINTLFNQAELALAAYATLSPGDTRVQTGALQMDGTGMSARQAEAFANTYTVIDQFTDPVSGFSATVFTDSSGNNYFALRGSELDIADWIGTNFGDIGADGIAIAQGVALFNYLQRLVTPAGSLAQQFEYVPPVVDDDLGIFTPATIRPIDSVAGLGYLSSASGFTVAGHSLGGHLAMAFGTLFAGQTGAITVFNAPGFTDTAIKWRLAA